MGRSRIVAICISLLLLFSVACGGGSTGNNPPPPPGQSASVSLTVRDTPPTGVTVLSFEVTVTRAVLQPGNVNLVTTPIEIEVKRLEVEAALLNTFNVAAGTYTSIEVTFTNPELTIKNDSAAAIAGCAAGAICEFKPNVTATVTYNGAPFPVTITANNPIGLLVDVNLSNIITGTLGVDFNAAGAIVVSNLPPAAGTGQLEEIEDVKGVVTAKDVGNNQFTLQLGQTSQSLTIRVDNNTEFDDFNDLGCATANFACVAVGQVLEVDLRLMAGGVLLARKVEAEDDNDNEEELEGIIVAINSPTQIELVILEELRNVAALDVGQRVQVNLLPSTQFRINRSGFNSLVSADFDAAGDMMVGQFVEVERKSVPSGTPPAFNTDRVRLKPSRFTGNVVSVDAANNLFVVNNLPKLLSDAIAPATQLEIRIEPGKTNFNNVTGLNGLAAGNTVSVRAWLFKGTGTPFGVAKKVRKR